MAKAWMRVLVVMLLLAGGATWARGQAPAPGGGVFAQDPVPPAPPEFCPDTAAGPVTSTPFPRASNDFANGFDEPCPCPTNCFVYGGVGPIALQRQRMGNGVVAVADPGLTVNVPGIPRNVDSGITPPPGAPTALVFGDTPSDYHWGVEATLGFQFGANAIELTGFYIGQQTDSRTFTAIGQYDLPFSAFRPPLGFEGDNFLWLQADRVGLSLETRLASLELNYRRQCQPWLELIFGARYVYQSERLGIFTDDGVLESPPPIPALQATYEVNTINRIYGGQFGFEIQHFLLPGFALSFSDKNMIGYNHFSVDNRLFRGDGLTRPEGSFRGNEISGLVELDLMATWWLNEHMRLRFGYQALWLLHLPQAQQQVNFDPTTPLSEVNDKGSIFYQGPRLEFQLAF